MHLRLADQGGGLWVRVVQFEDHAVAEVCEEILVRSVALRLAALQIIILTPSFKQFLVLAVRKTQRLSLLQPSTTSLKYTAAATVILKRLCVV